ncbi:MAG: hypothetical protein M3077_01005 [Candidatus Dormibacteraeota bacterium]|nr:hypothetical protein [Candidatus Dormibacteraeota bacterium]
MRSSWPDPEIESALAAAFRPVTVPAGATERMLATLPSRLPEVPLWRRRPVRYAAALAAAVILLIIGISPQARDALANAVQKVFYFLPGQGIRATEGESLVLAHPVAVTRNGITLTIISALANTKGTTFAYTVTGLPGGKDEKIGSASDAPQPYLVDATGHRYQIHAQSFGEGGSATENHAAGNLGFDPLRPGIRDVTLVIDSPSLAIPTRLASGLGRWTLQLHLETPAEAHLTPADMSTGGVTVHGITLHVDQVDRTASSLIVHLSGYGSRASGVNYLDLAPPLGSDNYLSGSGRAGEWDLTLPANATTLSVLRIHETEAGTATVQFSIPSSGSMPLNIPVALGRYQFVLEREAWIRDANGSRLRIYFRAGQPVDAGRVESWELDGVNSYGFAWGATEGADGYLELDNPKSGRITLHIKNPHVLVEGPWSVPLRPS